MNEKQLAQGLGWFSIGLGLAELLCPRALGRMIGVRGHRGTLQALGAREITSGIGLLSGRQPAGWLWSRVAGDIMDLALLGAAFSGRRNNPNRLAVATAAVAGATALDLMCSLKESRGNGHWRPERLPGQKPGPEHTIKVITVNRSPEELYRFWRNLENLPRFMRHLKSVTVTSEGRSHWVAKGPAGHDVEWDAELVMDRPGELIAWRSLPGSQVENAGSVRFERAPGGRGTVIRVHLQYRPSAGAVGRTVAKLFLRNPEKEIAIDLHRFKQYVETGEIATTEGQPSGRRKGFSKTDTLVTA